MGCSSNKNSPEYQEKHVINEAKPDHKHRENERTQIENISDIFREEEIALINQRKLKEDKDKSSEKDPKKICPLYQKLKVDLSKKEKTFTNYMVLYIPKDYNQLKSMKYYYYLQYNRTNYIFKENYDLVSSNPKTITGYGTYLQENDREYRDLPCISAHVEFTITQKDIKNGFIILSTTYNMDFDTFYGVYEFDFSFYDEDDTKLVIPKSALFFINDDYIINMDDYEPEEQFISLKKNELFAFNRKSFRMKMKDKNLKLDIRNEVNEELLSNFTDKDIEKINFTLNLRKWGYGFDNLIFHKVIHDITHNKDYIKAYYIVFSPCIDGKSGSYGEGYGEGHQEPIILKEFKINGKNVKNNQEEEDKSENLYGFYGYFISNETQIEFRHSFKHIFSICELYCESNEKVDYFQLDFSHFINGLYFELGNTFYYEIRLNGNSVKFSEKSFKYQIKNDKIILEGYLDDYDKQKYIELANQQENPEHYLEVEEKDRPYKWTMMRKDNMIPFKMELI